MEVLAPKHFIHKIRIPFFAFIHIPTSAYWAKIAQDRHAAPRHGLNVIELFKLLFAYPALAAIHLYLSQKPYSIDVFRSARCPICYSRRPFFKPLASFA